MAAFRSSPTTPNSIGIRHSRRTARTCCGVPIDRVIILDIWKARFDPKPKSTESLTNYTRVSSDGKDAQNPTMTKNGKWIVYASNNEDKPGIWKVPAEGGESSALVRGQFVRLADVPPSGRHAAYLVDDRVGRQNAIGLVDVESGLNTGFEIEVLYRRPNTADVTWGRARWMMNNGEWIVFVGQDQETREAAVYKQRFALGRRHPGHPCSAGQFPARAVDRVDRRRVKRPAYHGVGWILFAKPHAGRARAGRGGTAAPELALPDDLRERSLVRPAGDSRIAGSGFQR